MGCNKLKYMDLDLTNATVNQNGTIAATTEISKEDLQLYVTGLQNDISFAQETISEKQPKLDQANTLLAQLH